MFSMLTLICILWLQMHQWLGRYLTFMEVRLILENIKLDYVSEYICKVYISGDDISSLVPTWK